MRKVLVYVAVAVFGAAGCGSDEDGSISSNGGSAGVAGAAGAAGGSAGAAGVGGSGGAAGAAGAGAAAGMAGAAGAAQEITPENVDDLVGDPTSEDDMLRLADWMTGSFDSKDMEGETDVDSAGTYTYIWADLKQIRIWPDETDGYWFYVEQAEHGQPPYRTRIYHLTIQDGTSYLVDSYKLPYGSTTYSGAFEDPAVFDGVSIDDTGATHNPGCNVVVKRKGDKYYGHNDMDTCTVNMGVILNLDSFSVIDEDSFYSHDRGYDSSGALKMGPGNKGYTFVKRENYPVE